MQIGSFDGESDLFAAFLAVDLIWRGSPNGGIEGNIGGFSFGRARLDVTAAFALGLGTRATPRLPAGEPVDGGVDAAGGKDLPGFYFITTLPPVGIAGVKDILFGGFGRGLLLRLFVRNFWLYVTGFFFSSASASSGAGWVSSVSM